MAHLAGIRDVRALLLAQLGDAWREPGTCGRSCGRGSAIQCGDGGGVGCGGGVVVVVGHCQGTEAARGVASCAGEDVRRGRCVAVGFNETKGEKGRKRERDGGWETFRR